MKRLRLRPEVLRQLSATQLTRVKGGWAVLPPPDGDSGQCCPTYDCLPGN